MRASDPALARLVGGVAHGDQAAFHALYDRVAGQVYGLARLVLRHPEEAERVTEQALVEVWRTAPCFDPSECTPIVWILATTHRVAVDRARAMQVAPTLRDRARGFALDAGRSDYDRDDQ